MQYHLGGQKDHKIIIFSAFSHFELKILLLCTKHNIFFVRGVTFVGGERDNRPKSAVDLGNIKWIVINIYDSKSSSILKHFQHNNS